MHRSVLRCAGVLWQETRAIPGAAQTLKRLQSMVSGGATREAMQATMNGRMHAAGNALLTHSLFAALAVAPQGKLLLFATNNSGKSREAYLQKFTQLGFDIDISPVR